MKASIKTISEMTGFSQATISNVLNNKKGVKKSTAEAVLRAAREIGYLYGQYKRLAGRAVRRLGGF